MSRIDAFNISVEEYLGAIFLFVAIALIISAHRRRTPDRPWIAYCPVAILMASVVQAQNTLWGFQLAWYLVLVALAGVIFVLDRPSVSKLGLTSAMIFAVIGSYSSFQGLYIWVAGLLLLFYRRRPTRLLVAWLAAGVLATTLYLYRFNMQEGVPSFATAIHLPRQAVRFFFESIGDVLGVPLRSNDINADLVAGVGCVVFVVALFTLWSGHRRRDVQTAAPIGMALTVFGLLFALSTTWGRTWEGPAVASASRYTTNDILILVGAYLTFIALPRSGVPIRRPSQAATTKIVAATFGVLITLVAVFGFVNGIRWERSAKRIQILQAVVTVDIDHIPGHLVSAFLFEAATPANVLRADARVLAAHRLSLYSDPQAVARYRSMAEALTKEGAFRYTPPAPGVAFPATGTVLSGKTLLVASVSSDLNPVKVDLVLSGGVIRPMIIATSLQTFGWTVHWKTSSVPNGTYLLQCVVDTHTGVITSHAIVVIVKNSVRSATLSPIRR